ncbi:MAG: type II CAAX endopeptidase family protein [Bacteroidota bacterium]
MLRRFFWNLEERRLRSGWRLMFHLIMVMAGTLLMALVLVPVGGLEPSDTLAAAIGITVATWIAAKVLDQRPFADFGLHIDGTWWTDFGFGVLLGVVLQGGVFTLEYTLGWVTVSDTLVANGPGGFAWGFGGALLMFVLVGFYEELLSRGYHLTNLAEGFNMPILGPVGAVLLAWIVSSAAFGLAHAGNPNATWVSTTNISLAGILLGVGYVLTRSLAIPIGLHISWNFAQGNVFGFPVSGTDAGATLIDIEQGGPALWTGGAFGPEAGLLGLVAMAVGIGATVLWVRLRYGTLRIDASIATFALSGGPSAPDPPDDAAASAG